MTEILSGWVRAIAGAAVFCAMAAALCPKGRARGVLALASGCVMLLALVSPIARLDLTDFARAFGLPTVDFAVPGLLPPEGAGHYLDGLHPDAQGHRLMAQAAIAALPPLRA